jgi:hypothetical protein
MIRFYPKTDQTRIAPRRLLATSYRPLCEGKLNKKKIAALFSIQITLNSFLINANASNSSSIFVNFCAQNGPISTQNRRFAVRWLPATSYQLPAMENGYARYE